MGSETERPARNGPKRDEAASGPDRDAADILRDHAAIDRLADELLPALIDRLSSSGLGEIEVREGSWKARLRKPVSVELASAQPVVVQPAAAAPGSGHAATHPDEHRAHSQPLHAASYREDYVEADAGTEAEENGVVAARSPAVGVYAPRRDLVLGMPVRAGDRIGAVNVLGVNQDVLSPIDGVISTSLIEAGDAVEYGQELVRIETPERAAQERPIAGQKAASAASTSQTATASPPAASTSSVSSQAASTPAGRP